MIPNNTSLQIRIASPQERVRLVRLCARLAGNQDAAEDLAQETLSEAWRHLDSLRRPEMFASWLAGIAANVCRRWLRRAANEAMRTEPFAEAAEFSVAFDPERTLDRSELAALLDRALGRLRPADRQVLVARYVEDRPLAEIAAQGGWTANAAAARLHRGREALHRVLTTRLRADAAEFGLLTAEGTEWEQTRLWCFRCGKVRLEGRFTARSADGASFAVRCPRCDDAGDAAFSTAHPAMDAARVLGPTRSYKPAFRRVITWWGDQIGRGLRSGVWECWRCSGPMALQSDRSPTGATASPWHRARFRCGRCGAEFNLPISGLLFHSAEGQRFWQRHPRMHVAPERAVVHAGRRAVVARYEDVTGAAALEVLYSADTFQPLQIWGGVPTDAAP